MPLPRARFTIRRIMVATAITAALLGTWRRCAVRHATADYHVDRMITSVVLTADGYLARDRLGNVVSFVKSQWHDALATKYRNAAWTPWLPVAPDPPEPE